MKLSNEFAKALEPIPKRIYDSSLNVLFWLDDNPAVCERMASKYGVTTLQVR